MEEFVRGIFENRLTASAAVIIISVILYNLFGRIILKSRKINKKTTNQAERKRRTYMRLIGNVIKYSFIIITILILLQINGVNVSSMIAGLGIVSIVVGLALQDALKDIIMGFNIIVDNYFSVGDILKLDDFEGEVIELGVKSTKLRDVNNENVLVIANRNIMQALKLSDQLVVDIPLPYEENTTYMEEIIDTIITEIKNIENVKDAKYVGINEFADSAVIYRLLLYCSPEHKLSVKRSALRIIKLELDNRNITIPYTQIDIHQK